MENNPEVAQKNPTEAQKPPETTEKKEVCSCETKKEPCTCDKEPCTCDTETCCCKVSRFVWLPFAIIFILSLAILVLSFFETLPGNLPFVIKIKFAEQIPQLIILAVLMGISLLIPFWAYSVRKPRNNNGYPLGLPKGSIRAIITLIFVIGYIVLTFKSNQNALDDAKNLCILLAVLYFFSRIAEKDCSNKGK